MVKEKKTTKFDELITQIEKMSVLELSQFVKALEEKFGIPAMSFTPPAGGSLQAEGVQATAKEEEKAFYTIELLDPGSSKIQVIKLVKEITGKTLKDSKDFVEGQLPQVLKENVNKNEAEEIKKKFEQAGAKINLK